MSSNKRKIISIVLTVIFLALIIQYVVSNWENFVEIEIKKPLMLIGLIFSVALNTFATGMIMDTVLRPLGLRLHSLESFGLVSLSRLSNQVSPGKVGLLLRAGYLKKKHNFSHTKFLSTLAGTHVLLYATASALGLVSVLLLALNGIPMPIVFPIILTSVFTFFFIILFIPFRLKVTNKKFVKHIVNTINGWQIIREDRRILFLSIAWATVLFVSYASMMFFTFNSIGSEIGIAKSLFLVSVVIAGGIIALTPAGFGVNEGLFLIAAGALDIEPYVALTAALLQRLAVFIFLIFATPFFSRRLFGYSLIKTLYKHKYK